MVGIEVSISTYGNLEAIVYLVGEAGVSGRPAEYLSLFLFGFCEQVAEHVRCLGIPGAADIAHDKLLHT
jgi:hypothetical protein